MPGFLTNCANNLVLDSLFGGVRFDPPEILYFGLALNSANKSGFVTEPAAEDYHRVAVANTLENFDPSTSGTKANAVAIAFPKPADEWGRIAAVFVADAPEGGQVLAMADLRSERWIDRESQPTRILAGGLFLSHH